MQFRILGPIEIRDGDAPVLLRGPRERALLAYLLLHANEVVPRDRLIDELWGERPPATVASALHVYVSRLRKAFGENGAVLATRGAGYVLEIDGDDVDAVRFERTVDRARRLLSDGAAADAADELREALALWRGPPLADVADAEWARAEVRRLEELRIAAVEDRIDADLALARHAALVPELEASVRRHPTRERLRRQLIVALYRCGRQADALQAYADARRALAEELGLDPSPPLRELEQAILRQDPSLDTPVVPPRRRVRAQRRRTVGLALAAAGLVAIAAVAFFAVGWSHGGTRHRVLPPLDSVAIIDIHTNEVVGAVPLGGRPSAIASGSGAVWIGDYDDGTIVRVDPRTARITRTIGVGMRPLAVASAAGAIWAAGQDRLVRIDPRYVAVIGSRTIHQHLPGFSPSMAGYGNVAALAEGPAGLWFAHTVSAVSRIDPATGGAVKTAALDDAPSALAVGADGVWVVEPPGGHVTVIDPATGAVEATIAIPGVNAYTDTPALCSSAVTVGFGSVWATARRRVWRIDPLTDAAVESIPAGDGTAGITTGAGSVWLASYLAGTVTRIDPATNKVVATIRVGHNPCGIAVAGSRVFVTLD